MLKIHSIFAKFLIHFIKMLGSNNQNIIVIVTGATRLNLVPYYCQAIAPVYFLLNLKINK